MPTERKLALVGAGLCLALAQPAGAGTLEDLLRIKGDVEWGAYLSSECTACHGAAGGRIPHIAGLPREYMLSALHDYRSGRRDNATMQTIAKALGDDEIAALAAYFETAAD